MLSIGTDCIGNQSNLDCLEANIDYMVYKAIRNFEKFNKKDQERIFQQITLIGPEKIRHGPLALFWKSYSIYKGPKIQQKELLNLWLELSQIKSLRLSRPHYQAGVIYEKLKELSLAQQHYQKCLTITPQNEMGYLGLSRIAFERKNYEQGITHLSLVINNNPKNTVALMEMGKHYERMKNIEQAMEYYAKCQEIDPQHRESEEKIMAILEPQIQQKIQVEKQTQIKSQTEVFQSKKEEIISQLVEMRQKLARLQGYKLQQVFNRQHKFERIQNQAKRQAFSIQKSKEKIDHQKGQEKSYLYESLFQKIKQTSRTDRKGINQLCSSLLKTQQCTELFKEMERVFRYNSSIYLQQSYNFFKSGKRGEALKYLELVKNCIFVDNVIAGKDDFDLYASILYLLYELVHLKNYPERLLINHLDHFFPILIKRVSETGSIDQKQLLRQTIQLKNQITNFEYQSLKKQKILINTTQLTFDRQITHINQILMGQRSVFVVSSFEELTREFTQCIAVISFPQNMGETSTAIKQKGIFCLFYVITDEKDEEASKDIVESITDMYHISANYSLAFILDQIDEYLNSSKFSK